MRLHFIVHEIFEGPGAFDIWAQNKGYKCSYSRVYLGDKLPVSSDNYDFLIILGGPQSPATTKEECAHFDSIAEQTIIKHFIENSKMVLGICLGAQLIGEALKAPYDHSPFKEIGAYPITLTKEGRENSKLSHFPFTTTVGHWHSDMPGLTNDAKLLAYSDGCPRQIVEYSSLIYGFQCHLEFTPALVDLLIDHSVEERKALSDEQYVQSSDTLRSNDYSEMNMLLFEFLDKLVTEYENFS
ncbi:MAG: GMP synthase [Zetaproteobacteria bacterium]|nr:MAG: GMP synthase [Zetaproteobacteria bacterium]